jgi:hypothetical protein
MLSLFPWSPTSPAKPPDRCWSWCPAAAHRNQSPNPCTTATAMPMLCVGGGEKKKNKKPKTKNQNKNQKKSASVCKESRDPNGSKTLAPPPPDSQHATPIRGRATRPLGQIRVRCPRTARPRAPRGRRQRRNTAPMRATTAPLSSAAARRQSPRAAARTCTVICFFRCG